GRREAGEPAGEGQNPPQQVISSLSLTVPMGDIFGTDGIRDKAGHGFLAPEKIVQVARAAARILKDSPARFRVRVQGASQRWKVPLLRNAPGRGRVLIGRDTRASGPGIEHALAEGFLSMGVDVGLLGVITTPGVSLMTAMSGARLGIVISASHNPAE